MTKEIESMLRELGFVRQSDNPKVKADWLLSIPQTTTHICIEDDQSVTLISNHILVKGLPEESDCCYIKKLKNSDELKRLVEGIL